jgi:hypothetical protein
MGVFASDSHGQIRTVAVPGDPAPGGGVFDFADFPSINDAGDVAFGAHVRGEECLTGVSQTRSIHCDESLYLRRASGEILSIVHQGDLAPGGGTFRSILAPVINNRGEILFIGDLTPPPGRRRDLGVFLYTYTGGQVVPIALPGQELPGGGQLVTSAFQPGNWDLNNLGEVAFSAMLDTDTLGFGTNDTGLYVWSDGTLQVIARTGMEFPDLGTVLRLGPPEIPFPSSGALINARGDIVFNATFIGTDGEFVTALLKAETR